MEVARICWHSCIIRKNIGLRFSSLGKMAWKWRRWRNSILLFMAYCTLMFARPTISGQGKTSKYIHSTSLMFSVCAFYIIYMFIKCANYQNMPLPTKALLHIFQETRLTIKMNATHNLKIAKAHAIMRFIKERINWT